MSKGFIISFFFISLLFPGCLIGQEQHIIIQSGHNGPVSSLVPHPTKPLLFSAGEDGTVKVWDTEKKELIRSIRIFHRPVKEIAIHPLKPFIAVLKIREQFSSVLSVWNWETGEKQYAIDVKQTPLFFTFSTRGSYLVYGKREWKSLSFHDAETGEKLLYFHDGFGIVSYVVFSKSEKNLMTYQPSGKIMYWKIRSQEPLLDEPLSTLPNLSSISVSPKKTFFAASADDKLVIIDLISGKKIATGECPGMTATAISPDGTEILCLSKNKGVSCLHKFTFDGSTLQPVAFNKNSQSSSINAESWPEFVTLTFAGDYSYFATLDGRILWFNDKPGSHYEFSIFSKNELVSISDIALTKKTIALGNSEKILSFPLYFLDTEATDVDVQELSYEMYDNKLGTDTGLAFYSTIKLLSWSRNTEPAGFLVRNIKTGDIVEEYSRFSSALIQLDILDNGMITLEKDGHCAIRDKITYEPLFEYTLKSLNKIVYISDSMLVGARSKLSRFESSLISINPQTGEIVPLSDPALLCYDLAFHQKSNSLYSLGIGNSSESVTQLKIHYGRVYEDEKVLFTYPGEDLSAGLVTASSGDYVYTSLGYTNITAWDGKRISSFPECPHIPRKLYVADKLLISLNRDLSVSIWDRNKKERMLDLYLFKDYNWVAVLSDGRYLTSEEGEKYIR